MRFPKKGKDSPGVARQHCGPLGKTDNCQATVQVGYSGSKGYGLIDRQLYIPKKWFKDDYAAQRKKCKIPNKLTFKDKNTMAAEMINEVIASGLFQAKWIGADSAFGSDSDFLDAIPAGYYYFADVHKNQHIFDTRPKVFVPEYSGRGAKPKTQQTSFASVEVKDFVAGSPAKWERVYLGDGAKGPIYANEKCFRVIEVRNKLPGKEVWLYVRQLENGDIIYTLSNAPADIPIGVLRKQALRRWPIEQCFEECKDELGLDHFEGRSWQGFHRHMLLVSLAHMFLLKIRKTFTVKNAVPIDEIQNSNVADDVPILTLPNAKRLVDSAIIENNNPDHTQRIIEYYLRHNSRAKQSHARRKLKSNAFITSNKGNGSPEQ
jgi:SRSO17 transposase